MTKADEQNLLRLCHYEAFRTGLDCAVSAMPPDHRELYIEQALSACLAVSRDRLPAETPAICRRVGLDVMLAPPRAPRAKGIWRRLDSETRVLLAIYGGLLLLACVVAVVFRVTH